MRIPVLSNSALAAAVEAALFAIEKSVPTQTHTILGHGIKTDFVLPQ